MLPLYTRRDVQAQIATGIFWTLLVVLATVLAYAGPVLTSDGPAHVDMGHFLTVANNADWPMQKMAERIGR